MSQLLIPSFFAKTEGAFLYLECKVVVMQGNEYLYHMHDFTLIPLAEITPYDETVLNEIKTQLLEKITHEINFLEGTKKQASMEVAKSAKSALSKLKNKGRPPKIKEVEEETVELEDDGEEEATVAEYKTSYTKGTTPPHKHVAAVDADELPPFDIETGEIFNSESGSEEEDIDALIAQFQNG